METLSNLLKTFTIDYWYKMLLLASLGLFVLSVTTPLLVIPNAALALLSLGGFLIGMGEWINHPYREAISSDLRYKITGYSRSVRPGGAILDVVGGVLLACSVWKIAVALW